MAHLKNVYFLVNQHARLSIGMNTPEQLFNPSFLMAGTQETHKKLSVQL